MRVSPRCEGSHCPAHGKRNRQNCKLVGLKDGDTQVVLVQTCTAPLSLQVVIWVSVVRDATRSLS